MFLSMSSPQHAPAQARHQGNPVSRVGSAGADDLPVIYVHHGAQGDMIYADQPVLIVHVDDGAPHDRMFVRASSPPPEGLVHGPVSCTGNGDAETVRRKRRLVAWLKRVAAGVAARAEGGRIQ